ncbi:biotin synthase [Bradyrhizobium yuanmingense]|uniref:Biotin synthase n=1 Tax=Bradyrhizobium yuanmingense TaxID=108015 RepID=A0A0R3CUV0_9BRAD|nr:biotin synthase BioB [Bradyrhizobium yuanmingense]KRP98843.1 biotin synthase [Bradyrhizobium yuanmingense]
MSGLQGAIRGNVSQEQQVRRDWTRAEAEALHGLPFADLIFRAQSIHRDNFDPNLVELASLLSIKTGGCPEDCAYCSQSAHYDTGLKAMRLMEQADVVAAAKRAKDAGATRFCMAAAWRSPKDRDLDRVCDMVSEVKRLGMETCVTLGMLTSEQAERLSTAGLDFYNHNVDTSPEFYGRIITTHTLQDRINTLAHVRRQGIKVCSGGIIGMGERVEDRLGMLVLLANLTVHPDSVPVNLWNEIDGVPVAETAERPDPIEVVRLIAVARILMPRAVVRLSAGRQYMTDELQALCFLAGANSIFIGDTLLTTKNPQREHDVNLLSRLGIVARAS